MPEQYENAAVYQPWMINVTRCPLTLSLFQINYIQKRRHLRHITLTLTPQVDPNCSPDSNLLIALTLSLCFNRLLRFHSRGTFFAI